MPTLVFEIEDGSQVVAPLDGRATIGRAEGNDVVAEREDVAPHHAEVFWEPESGWWVRDMNTAAGTFVNGSRVTTQRLGPGDLLQFGTVSARFSTDGIDAGMERTADAAPAAVDTTIEEKKLELAQVEAALKRARAEFERTVGLQQARLAALREEAAQLEPAMGKKRQELNGLDAELAKAMAGLEKATKAEQERILALRLEAARLEPAVADKRQEISQLHSGLTEARVGFERRVKEQEERLDSLREEASKLDAEVTDRRRELAGLGTDVAQARIAFEKSFAEQDALLDASRGEVAKLETVVGNKRQELAGLESNLAQTRAAFTKSASEHDAILHAARAEAAKLEAAVGSRKRELSVLGAALASAQMEREAAAKVHETRVTELQEQASGLESEITGLTGAVQEAHKIIDESLSHTAGLEENRRRHEELAQSVAEAAGRHEVIAHQIRTLGAQQRTKLVEMERLERDLADLETRKAAAADVLEQLEAERQRSGAALEQLNLRREQAAAEFTELAAEKGGLADEVRRLDEQRGSMGPEISALQNRKIELNAILEALDARHEETAKQLAVAAGNLTVIAARHDHMLADLARAEARHAELQGEADQTARQLQGLQADLESHGSTQENLVALNETLQAEIASVGNRLAELSGTEERLMESRAKLQETEAAHLSLTNTIAELTRSRETGVRAEQELESRIARLREVQDRLERELPAFQSSHDRARGELASFEEESGKKRLSLTEEIELLRAASAGERAGLDKLLAKVAQARLRQSELEQQNREFEAAAKRLDEVRAQSRSAEIEKHSIESQTQVLRQACADTKIRLAELENAEKSADLRISRLNLQETDLQHAVSELANERQHQQERWEELRKLSADAETENIRQKEELAAGLAEMRAEIARLEDRLAHARNWNAELDNLYEKLGRMPGASPEAREAWLEIQQRKKEISDQLPSGIQVRPQSRPTVVPRGR